MKNMVFQNKIKSFTTCAVCLFFAQFGYSQVIFSEDFDGIGGPISGGPGTFSFPSGWLLMNVDNQAANANVAYVNQAWERREDFASNVLDSCAFSTSWTSPTGIADDWMWTPALALAGCDINLSWNAIAYDPDYQDGYEVRIMVSPQVPSGSNGNIGNMLSNSVLLFSVGAENSVWTNRTVNLTAYSGQTVRIAYRNNSNDKFLLLIDDIIVQNTITPPVPNTVSLSDVTAECSVTPAAPTAIDNCSSTIFGTPDVAFPISTPGTTLITWTYAGVNGTLTTQTQNVIINDVTSPVADAVALADVISECEVLSLISPTATDNCSGNVNVTNNASFPINTQGTTAVTWTYTDANGNASTQIQNVVINDVTLPVADVSSLPDITAECEVLSLSAPTATDNCSGIVNVTNNASFPITTQGTTAVTWTYTDANGNASTQLQNVVISDVTSPIADVSSLPDITAECEVLSLSAPTATDNCGGVVIVSNNASLPITTQGVTAVTWTYTDANGNASTQLQNVVISDLTAPIADLPALSEITACFEVVPTAPTATDNCNGSIVGVANVTFPITAPGLTLVTWTFNDGNGNSSSQTQNVFINTTDNTVTQVGSLLTANAAGAAYQWLNCANGNAIVAGETNQSFTPATTGSYAVVVTENGCADTSACFLVDYTSLDDLSTTYLHVYPNPSLDGYFRIQFDGFISDIQLFDLLGRGIDVPVNYENGILDASALDAGKYFIHVHSDKGKFIDQLVKVN